MSATTEFGLRLRIEILAWVLALALAALVVFPLWQYFTDLTFISANFIFVLVFLTFTRYLFLLPYSLLAQAQVLKFILIFLCLPLIFYEINYINAFQIFLDDDGLQGFDQYFKAHVPEEDKMTIIKYVSREYLFFGISAVIVTILLPFRLLRSFWLVYNNKDRV